MNAGHDKSKALARAKASANWTGTSRYLWIWNGVYQIGGTDPCDGVTLAEKIDPDPDVMKIHDKYRAEVLGLRKTLGYALAVTQDQESAARMIEKIRVAVELELALEAQ